MMFQSPKNFKRGRLLANKYRPVDIVMAVLLTALSLILILVYLLAIEGRELIVVGVLLIPLGIGMTLIIPLNVYHNLLEFIHLLVLSKTKRSKWRWEGVYYYDPFKTKDE